MFGGGIGIVDFLLLFAGEFFAFGLRRPGWGWPSPSHDPKPSPPSLPGARPSRYTYRTSFDAPFWVQR